jgi:hypothetical protein
LVVGETGHRVASLFAHASAHFDSHLVVIVGSGLETGTAALLVASNVAGTVVVGNFLGVFGEIESFNHTAGTTTSFGRVALARSVARKRGRSSPDLGLGSDVGAFAGWTSVETFVTAEDRLTVTVLDTGPLVAELLTRDLASLDRLRDSVGSSPVLETSTLGVVVTSGPAGMFRARQGIQSRLARVGRVEIPVIRSTTSLVGGTETSSFTERGRLRSAKGQGVSTVAD